MYSSARIKPPVAAFAYQYLSETIGPDARGGGRAELRGMGYSVGRRGSFQGLPCCIGLFPGIVFIIVYFVYLRRALFCRYCA